MSELPQGWVVCQLSDTGQIVTGKTPSTKEPRFYGGDIPFIKPGDLDRSGPVITTEVYLTDDGLAQVPALPPASIVVTCIGNLGKVGITTKLSASNQQINAVVPDQEIDPKYIFHYCKTLKPWLESESSATTISIVNKGIFSTAPVPLAPLAEQTRIAQKLDELLAQVDTLKARIDSIPALLKRFRQSVLAAAVSGRLTEEWRQQNSDALPLSALLEKKPIFLPKDYKRLSKQKFKIVNREFTPPTLPENWEIYSIADLYEKKALIDFADGNHGSLYPRAEEFGETGAMFLTATQMDDNWNVSTDECPLLNREKANQLTKGWAISGDVLLSHNATVGRVGILVASEPVILGTSVTFYRFHEDAIERGYARVLFSSRFFQEQLEGSMEQTTRNQVPITAQVSLKFICPPIAEQRVISKKVEQLFAFADQLAAKVALAKSRIDHLTQSILAKAFRGELVPQDPNDEPASVLLERIQAQRAAAPKAKRGRKSA